MTCGRGTALEPVVSSALTTLVGIEEGVLTFTSHPLFALDSLARKMTSTGRPMRNQAGLDFLLQLGPSDPKLQRSMFNQSPRCRQLHL